MTKLARAPFVESQIRCLNVAVLHPLGYSLFHCVTLQFLISPFTDGPITGSSTTPHRDAVWENNWRPPARAEVQVQGTVNFKPRCLPHVVPTRKGRYKSITTLSNRAAHHRIDLSV